MTLLEAEELRVVIDDHHGNFSPVDGVSLTLSPGEALALVGESGSGKTLTLKAIVDLLPSGAKLVGGEVRFQFDRRQASSIPGALRGAGVAMIFQEPMSALNPLLRCGRLIADAHRATHHSTAADAKAAALGLMEEVGIPAAAERMRAYPHQLSGGLRQRVMIAMALATEPRVLLCDEPTTALDVTIQKQILALLDRIRRDRDLAMIYVTHDLAVVPTVCDRLAVMYAGRIVETGSVAGVFASPAHPYTRALLAAVPRLDRAAGMVSIPGAPPDPRSFPSGCRFHPRCAHARPDCLAAPYRLRPLAPDRETACVYAEELSR